MKSIDQLKKKDLNCNIFSVYDYDGLTITELLCQFFTKINECIDIANKTIDLAQWLVEQGLSIEVSKKLELWLNDGTLEDLISEELFREINEKINTKSFNQKNIMEYYPLVENKGENNEDWIKAINKAIDDLKDGGELFFPGGEYKVTDTIKFKGGCNIRGIKGKSIIKLTTPSKTLIDASHNNDLGIESFNSKLENISLMGLGKDSNQIGISLDSWIFELNDCDIAHFNKGVLIDGVILDIRNCYIHNCKKGIELTTLKNSLPSTMINLIRCQIHYNDIGFFTSDYGNPNEQRPVINLQVEKVAFEYNGQAYYIKGAMNCIIKHCWFEQNNEKPYIDNYSILFEQNRYEGGEPQEPLMVNQGVYSGFTKIDCGGTISSKNIVLQEYTHNELKEHSLSVNNNVLNIDENVIPTISNNGHIRNKITTLTIHNGQIATINGEDGKFTLTKNGVGNYTLKINGYFSHPIINVQPTNELYGSDVVCVVNCSFVDDATYRDWFSVDTINIKTFTINTSNLVDCKLMITIIHQ